MIDHKIADILGWVQDEDRSSGLWFHHIQPNDVGYYNYLPHWSSDLEAAWELALLLPHESDITDVIRDAWGDGLSAKELSAKIADYFVAWHTPPPGDEQAG